MKLLFIFFYVILFLSKHEAHAYIDPGSGSFLFQFFLAFIFGIIYFSKNQLLSILFFLKKKIKFGNKKNKK